MSLLKKSSLVGLIILTLLIGSIVGLVATKSGLHFLINSAARWVPGLAINSVSGGWRDLTLNGIQYKMPGVTINANQFHLALELSCLKNRQLCINALKVQDVDVVVNSKELAPASATTKPLTELRTPYPIILKLLTLNNVKVTVDDTTIALNELRTGAQWQQRVLTLLPTEINALRVALPKTPSEVIPDGVKATTERASVAQSNSMKPTSANLPLSETLTALFEKPLLPALPDIRLPLDIIVQEIAGQQWGLTGDTDLLIDTLLLKASTQAQHIQLDTLDIKSPQGALSARGQVTLADKWPIDMVINSALDIEPLQGEKVKLTLDGALQDQLKAALDLSGPVNAQVDLNTQLSKVGLPTILTLQSEQLRWPLTGDPQYQLNELRMRFDGTATDYAVSLNANITGPDLLPAGLIVKGKGNLEQFDLAHLRLTALQGHADLSGVVNWRQAISWNTVLTLNGINTATQWPEWPGKFEGKITTEGSVDGDRWQLQIPTLQIDGNIKQNKVSAHGSLIGNASGRWQVPGIKLALGRNKMEVKGNLDESWHLDANLDAPHLDGALPGLGGVAKGGLKLRGTLKAPHLLVNLAASGLQWQALRVHQVNVEGDIRSSDQVQGQLAVRVEQLAQKGAQIKLLTLDAKGSEKQHQLHVLVDGTPISGQLALNGHFDRLRQRWQGNMSNTRIDTPAGEWRLSQAVALDYLNPSRTITIKPHCWQNLNAQLCVPETIEAGPSGRVGVVLNRFDLAMIKPLLGPDMAMEGALTGRADVSWTADGDLPQATLSLAGNGVKIQQMVQGSPLPIAFDTLDLNAELRHDRAQINWMVNVVNNGQFRGQVQIAHLQEQRDLSGNINISNISLAILDPILIEGEKAAGMLNADLRLGGSMQHPLIYGQWVLNNVDINGHWMPFDITEGRLAMNFDGRTSILKGLIHTPRGQLNLSGNADWRNIDAWRARIAAKGDKLRVTIPLMVQVDVSPDLVFEATPQLLSLNGLVDIPWARIVVQEMPKSVVDVSADEVLLNNQLEPVVSKKIAIPISSHLMIHVGNDVRLDAFGLKAKLQGDLKMVQDEHGLGLHGQINIPFGSFHAYGQDLVVQKGQLLFSGPPDRPLLNIDAIRNRDSTEDGVTAGVQVSGLADAPKLKVFSTSASGAVLSQEEALSYLLRGQSLKSAGADGQQMTSILIGIGVAKSGKLVGKIGEAFGISNLALDTQGSGDKSQIVVSGYILPGLQVKYGVGIFNSLAALTLRYRLMPRLYLEAVSSIDQALDMFYQFEF